MGETFFCDRGVKNELIAGRLADVRRCEEGENGPVDLVVFWRFALGGGLMSLVADAMDLFIVLRRRDIMGVEDV